MAVTQQPSNAITTVKLFESKLGFMEMMKRFQFGQMTARGVLQRASELDRAQKGDQVTVNQLGRLTGIGFTEGETVENNEEAMNRQGFQMQFNMVRHAVAYDGLDTIGDTRSYFNSRDNAEDGLVQWHGSRLDASCFNQLAGSNATSLEIEGTVYTGSKRSIVQGLNTVVAPSANRIVRSGSQPNDESLTSADLFSLDLIDNALEKLQISQPTAAPLNNQEFDLFISHEQYLDLKRDSTSSIQWYINSIAEIEGGNLTNNPIMEGTKYGTKMVGKYNNVCIYTSNNVSKGVSSVDNSPVTTARRAVLCGKGALMFASKFSGTLTGDETTGGKAPLQYFRENRDYSVVEGTEGRMIYGVKKVTFEGEDLNSLVISTYAAPHS